MSIDTNTISCTINKKGEHHSYNDKPAIIYKGGLRIWCLNGEVHRQNKPAKIWGDGDQEWYLNGKMHREDGPARDYVSQDHKGWYLNNEPATPVREKLHVEKVVEIEGMTAIITKEINNLFFEAVVGDEKKLVVSLDKYKEA